MTSCPSYQSIDVNPTPPGKPGKNRHIDDNDDRQRLLSFDRYDGWRQKDVILKSLIVLSVSSLFILFFYLWNASEGIIFL